MTERIKQRQKEAKRGVARATNNVKPNRHETTVKDMSSVGCVKELQEVV
jgi:hypothetical protein